MVVVVVVVVVVNYDHAMHEKLTDGRHPVRLPQTALIEHTHHRP